MALRRSLVLVVLLAIAKALQGTDLFAVDITGTRLVFLFGVVLLAGHLAGGIARDMGLPRITGFILVGVLIGPGALGVLTAADVASLRFIDAAAIALIALSAGGELKLSELRSQSRSMIGILTAEMIAVFVVMFGLALLLADVLPFTAGRPMTEVLVIAVVFASIAIANSPAVTVAVVNDQDAKGPVSSTILGVTVLKDLVIIVLFAVVLSVTRSAFSAESGGLDIFLVKTLWWEIGGSIAIGAGGGWLISLYLRDVKVQLVPFVLVIAFGAALLGEALRLEVLLLALAAGFFVENISPERGEPFIHAVEANSVPVYAIFFTLAGASISLDALVSMGPIIALIVVTRGAAIWIGTRTGARLSGAPEAVGRYAWTGFVSQAGVTLGMVTLAAQAFPSWGEELRTLFVALVAVHELVGPPLLQWGLRASGEAGAGARRPVSSAVDQKVGLGRLGDHGDGGVPDSPLDGDGPESLDDGGKNPEGHGLVHP